MSGRWTNVAPLALSAELASTGPVVVGATGGSGTRVLARLLKNGGTFIGPTLNPYEDALPLGEYSDRWINSVESTTSVDPQTTRRMCADLEAILTRDYATLPEGTRIWGWKEPRSIYLLDFYDAAMPSLKFVHFVRDGRDMAFSDNQNQLVKHGDAVLAPDGGAKKAVRSAALWSAINTRAADYGETQMQGRYLRLRFEDLCSAPAETARSVWAFLGLPGDPGEHAEAEVSPPDTLGRWRDESPAVVRDIHDVAGDALARFGYV